MGITGLVGLLVSARAAFGAVTRAINQVEGNPKPRSFILARLRYLLMATLVFTLLVVSVTVASVVELLITTNRGWIRLPWFENTIGLWILGWVTAFAVMFLMFALVNKEAPTRPTRWQVVWPGALVPWRTRAQIAAPIGAKAHTFGAIYRAKTRAQAFGCAQFHSVQLFCF